jgi:hypothetical protein
MLRLSKKLKPRARRTNGKRRFLEDMKGVLVFRELQWAKIKGGKAILDFLLL